MCRLDPLHNASEFLWFTLLVSISPSLLLALSCLISKAVCYLNNHGEDYKGGILQFQDGDPSSIVPVAGVSKYTFTLAVFSKILHKKTNACMEY